MFNVGQAGLDLIKSFEGCRLTAYKALPSEQYYTIGWGHYGADVGAGDSISQAQADSLLKQDCQRFVSVVNNCRYADSLNQSQFDALVSFAYNCGAGCLNTLCAENDSLSAVAQDMLNYCHAGGKVLAGLQRRRKAEYDLFMSGEQEEEQQEQKEDIIMIEMHKLAQGDHEPQVLTLQALLNEFNGAGLALDADFGSLTYQAVIDYQRSRHLAVDGVVGQETWTQLLTK